MPANASCAQPLAKATGGAQCFPLRAALFVIRASITRAFFLNRERARILSE
jgi:hypothetical protein